VWTHVAVVLDGERGVLYTNGVPVTTNAALNLVPADLGATNLWFGRSQWPDPYFSGRLSAVRLFARPLSAAEIVAPIANIAQPAHGHVYRPGEVLNFHGSAADFYAATISATSLVWTVQWRSNTTVVKTLGPLSGVTNGSFSIPSSGDLASNGFYRIQLVATDGASRNGTNHLDVFPATSTISQWASFYPFTSNANDASNRFNGTLANGASIVADPARSNVVNLSGGSQYVNLPGGAGALNTFSGWVKWNGGNAWQRIFDFGVDTSRWLFLTPKDGDGKMQCAITTDSARYNRVLQAAQAFPTNEWTHVAVVFDGKQGVLYTNGRPAVVHNSVNLLPSDIGVTRAWLGRSQYPADPYFNGRLDSVRLNSRALSLTEITAPTAVITAPTSVVFYAGGDMIMYAGRATDYADAPLAPGAFTWSAEFQHDGLIDSVFGPLIGVTNGSFAVPTTAPNSTNVRYRLRLSVTDTNGNQQTVFTEVPPKLSTLSFDTVPSGLSVQYEGQPLNTPTSLVTVAGMTRNLAAPTPQNQNGTNYSFVVWSDGGMAAHNISVPATNSSFIASFMQPEISLSANGGSLGLSWPSWAAGLQLHAASNLAPPVAWDWVTNAPTPSNNLLWLSVPITGEHQYFRLQSP
jgi:hypothetical protein